MIALRKQLDATADAHTAFFTTEVAERLADRMIADAPPGSAADASHKEHNSPPKATPKPAMR